MAKYNTRKDRPIAHFMNLRFICQIAYATIQAEVQHRSFGGNVNEYMGTIIEEDPTKHEAHFANYIADGKDADAKEEAN